MIAERDTDLSSRPAKIHSRLLAFRSFCRTRRLDKHIEAVHTLPLDATHLVTRLVVLDVAATVMECHAVALADDLAHTEIGISIGSSSIVSTCSSPSNMTFKLTKPPFSNGAPLAATHSGLADRPDNLEAYHPRNASCISHRWCQRLNRP